MRMQYVLIKENPSQANKITLYLKTKCFLTNRIKKSICTSIQSHLQYLHFFAKDKKSFSVNFDRLNIKKTNNIKKPNSVVNLNRKTKKL